MASALHQAVQARGVHGRLILVGHSLGGDVTLTYAARYPAAVLSLVPLDATPADYATRALRLIPSTAIGLDSSCETNCSAAHETATEQRHSAARSDPLPRSGDRVLEHGFSLATISPVYGAALEKLWRAGQRHWASFVPNTKVTTVAQSTHYIHVSAPNLVTRLSGSRCCAPARQCC
jgi:pimeloyl-ACP methyl ester carboxylesterase